MKRPPFIAKLLEAAEKNQKTDTRVMVVEPKRILDLARYIKELEAKVKELKKQLDIEYGNI